MKNLLILFLLSIIFSACDGPKNNYDDSLGDKIQFVPTDFSTTCEQQINTLGSSTHGNVWVYVNNSNSFIGFDSLSNVLNSLKQYDQLVGTSTDTYKKTCNGLHIITWHKPTIIMKRFEFETKVYIGNAKTNKISIIDFHIQKTDSSKQIHLRLSDNRIEELIIDSITYTPIYEVRLVGLNEAESKLDSIKSNCVGHIKLRRP